MGKHHNYNSLILLFVFSLAIAELKAQENANYILKETKISETSPLVQNYQFFDGLGRETVEATNGISNNGEFTYSFHEFLGENMLVKNWLPVVDNSAIFNMGINDVVQKSSVQYSDNKAYVDMEYDALGRLKKQCNAGLGWKNKPSDVSYVTNTSNDVKRYILKFNINDGFTINDDSCYKAGTLLGVCYTNEDGVRVTTYSDVTGKKILERRGSSNDTYYVYDRYDRLAYVLMPEYQNENDLDLLEKRAFLYEYDAKGNNTIKKIPGCAPIEYCYDKCDRCIAIQDGALREKDLFRFRLYDNLGRLAIQGLSTTRPYTYNNFIVYYDSGTGGIENTDYNLPDGITLNRNPKRNNAQYVDYNEAGYYGYDITSRSSSELYPPLMPPPPVKKL